MLLYLAKAPYNMSHLLSSLLYHPFEKGQLTKPSSEQRSLFLGAGFSSEISTINNATFVQGFKPFANDLLTHNIQCFPALSADDNLYDYVFCVIPKQKEEALYRIAQGVKSLKQGGWLVSAAANDAGAKRLEKWFQDLGLKPQSLSKSKCRIVWASNDGVKNDVVEKYIKDGDRQQITLKEKIFTTKPGIFSWNKIDLGSKLLIENISEKLRGIGADFGCGYGYLSGEILEKHDVKKLYAVDADYEALECARENLKKFDNVEYSWADLTVTQKELLPLDWIIMNPPFHQGKDTKIDAGQAFIKTASGSLKKGGVLYMVANAHLPYENLLESLFSDVQKLVEGQGFKVFRGIR